MTYFRLLMKDNMPIMMHPENIFNHKTGKSGH